MDISVIIPVYGTEKYLRRCIDSVISQQLKNIRVEIIIVNDASKDNSLAIINEYLERKNNIILINKEKNEGLSSARNSGIKVAKGRYLFHLDSDDWIEKDCLQELYDLTDGDKADIVTSDFYVDYGNRKKIYIQEGTKREINNVEFIKEICHFRFTPHIWGRLIRKDLYLKNKILHIDGVNLGEDLAVILRLLFFSKVIRKKNKAYLHYVQNYQSITKKKATINNLVDIVKVLEINKIFFENNGREFIFEINALYLNYLGMHLIYSNRYKDDLYLKSLDKFLNLLKSTDFKSLSREQKLFYIFNKRSSFYFIKYFLFLIYKIKVFLLNIKHRKFLD